MTYFFHSLKFLLKKCSGFFFPPRAYKEKHFLNTDVKAVVSQQKPDWLLKNVFESTFPFSK